MTGPAKKKTALQGVMTATAAILTIAAFSSGLLYLDRLIERPLVTSTANAAGSIPAGAKVRALLAERIDEHKQGVGIVVGIVSPKGRSVVSHGKFGIADPRPVDGDTLFEIGSITKVFTAMLLTDMAERGEVALNDSVARYLPEDVTMPGRDGKTISFTDLATHMSGLPRLPDNLAPADEANPYADYTTQQLYAFLSGYILPRRIGVEYEYSNLGFGLLGHALARRAGVDYATLVRLRITDPLGMSSTAITLTPDLAKRMARGHDSARAGVPNWDLPTLAGAGALRSSVNDLLVFLEMALGQRQTPRAVRLSKTLATTLATRRQITDGGATALGWVVTTNATGEVIWHNGGTGGFSSFIAFHPRTKVGVVILSNTNVGIEDIGVQVLRSLVLPANGPIPG